MNARLLTLMLVLGAAVAHGENKVPIGTWNVVAPKARVGTRTIARDAKGKLSLTVSWPGTGEVVTLTGPDLPDGELDLQAELGEKGMIRELQGEAAPKKSRFLLLGKQLPPEEDGAERIQVTWSRDGRTSVVETWTRTNELGLELVSLSPEDWNPKVGPLTVTYRVVGARQSVRLSVRLPGGQGPRTDFYRKQLGGAPSAPVEAYVQLLGLREPGTYETTLEGRDSTAAARILLAGEWTIRLESSRAKKPPAEGRCYVTPPRVELVAPRWLQRDTVAPGTGKPMTDPGSDHRPLAEVLSGPVSALGATQRSQLETGDPEQLIKGLAESAMVVVNTHGWSAGITLYPTTPEERAASPVPREDPSKIIYLSPAELDELVQSHGGDRPLRDLHTVILYSCETGANGAAPGATMGTEEGAGVPTWLISQGADVVVAFDRLVFRAEGDHYLPRVFQDLSSKSGVKPKNGVRSLQWAAHEAAEYADKKYWKQFTPEKVIKYIEGGVGRLEDCVRIFEAGGIMADQETFDPPRYGNSRN